MKKLLALVGLVFCCSSYVHAVANPVTRNKVYLTSQSELNGYTKKYPVVVLFISKEGCPHCAMMQPIMDQLVNEMSDVKFVYIDGDDRALTRLVDTYAPEGFPEIKIFYKDREVKSMGSVSKASLVDSLNRYRKN